MLTFYHVQTIPFLKNATEVWRAVEICKQIEHKVWNFRGEVAQLKN